MTDVPGWLVLTTILDRLQLARYPDLQLSMTKVELGEGPGPDPLPIRPSGWPDGINPKTGVPDPAVEIWINSDPSDSYGRKVISRSSGNRPVIPRLMNRCVATWTKRRGSIPLS